MASPPSKAGPSSGPATPPLPPAPSLKDYNFSERLGQGSYGEVFKAYRKTGAREVVAVKCMQRSKLSKAAQNNLISEISVMKQLKHPHIVQLTDFQWDKHYIYILMEYCGGGDLSRFLKSRKKLPEEVCRRFLQQVAIAMRYLRSKDVAHMDLKPGNILLTGGRSQVLKIADFGFATHLSSDQTKSSICGSPLYMAPEILDRKYDAKVDLWSIGVILFECLFGKAPYKSETREEVYAKLRQERPINVPKQAEISDACRDLLHRCLQRDPLKRIEFEDFFAHPFLDLDYLPSDESESKAQKLVTTAEEKERAGGDLQAAFDLYTDALKYLVPLVKSCSQSCKRQQLAKKTVLYMEKAEELKLSLGPSTSEGATASSSTTAGERLIQRKDVQRFQQRNSVEKSTFQDLLELSTVTPRMTTGLEIAKAAEDYELELKYGVALEKYKTAIEILLPLLGTEPPGHRQKLLKSEVARWLARAEMVEKLMSIQNEVLSRRMALDVNDDGPEKASKTCKLQ